jgi:tRNA dimethylallyltransferase
VPRHLFILGPTASGKHAAAMAVARRLGGEIVSVDSMKVYRGLDIGTAKPSAGERALVPHHLIDVVDPTDRYTAGRFVQEAAAIAPQIADRGLRPIFSGGTFLYYKAFAYGLFQGPAAHLEIRQQLLQEAAEKGAAALHDELRKSDPASATRIHPNDLKRLVRALEVLRMSGKPISQLQRQWPAGPGPNLDAFCLLRPLDSMDRRLEARIDGMLAQGLIDECRRLQPSFDRLNPEIQRAIGYGEGFAHLRGEMALEAARIRMIRRTHRFVRKQLAWARSLQELRIVRLEPEESAEAVADRIISMVRG